MQSVVRRALLYGSATPVLSALIYAGFVYRAEADVGTLLGAVNAQLRLAMSMPAKDKDGKPLVAREELLAKCATQLESARAREPQSPIIAEFEGFLANLRGEPRTAAAHYRRARSLPGCEAEQRDTLIFNEARMLATAGDPAAALAVMTSNQKVLQETYRSQCQIESARYLHSLGRDPEAAEQIAAATAQDQPMTWLEAGRLYVEIGRRDAAEAAFTRAAAGVPIADYELARLKLAAGEVDSAFRLLERAAKAVPAEVGRLLREDAAAWQELRQDARFKELTAPRAATPGR